MSKALGLAVYLQAQFDACPTGFTLYKDAADELHRLDALNAELVEVCQRIVNLGAFPSDIAIMSRLIVKAKEQA